MISQSSGHRGVGEKWYGAGKGRQFEVPGERLHPSRLFDPAKTEVMDLRPHGRGLKLFRERLAQGYEHPLLREEVEETLSWVHSDDLEGIHWIGQLQLTAKREAASNPWAMYFHDVALSNTQGSFIALYAEKPGVVFEWGSSLRPEDVLELRRLEAEGYAISKEKRGYRIQSTWDAVRSTCRRSLLHEIGHHVDRKAVGDALWAQKPEREKEVFAERYAVRVLAAQGIVLP